MSKNKTYRIETYFVGGKMKKRKIPLIEGVEVEEFIRRNADDGFLRDEGYYHILGERQMKTEPNQHLRATDQGKSGGE